MSGDNRTFFIWDARGEYRDLLQLFAPEELVWLEADELGLNPFEVPKDRNGRPVMLPERWINSIREWLRIFWLNEPSLNLLCEILLEEYRRRGLLEDHNGDYPSLSEVIEAIEQISPQRGSDRAKAREKLLDRLKSLRAMLPGLDVKRSRNLALLLERSVILDITGPKDIARPALFALVTMIKAEILGLGPDASITRMEVIDEAHELLGGQTDKRTADLKEGRPSSLLRDLRKTGTCGVAVTHMPADLSPAARGNLGSVVVFRQANRACVREAAGMANVEPWREAEVARLPARHAIARFSRHGDPVYLKVKDARALLPSGLPPPTREEARERSRPVLEAIPYVRNGEQLGAGVDGCLRGAKGSRSETSHVVGGNERGGARPDALGIVTAPEPGTGSDAQPPEGGLYPRELRVFARICERPWELISDRADVLGLDRDGEGDARAKLETCGLTAFAGKVGAKNLLFAPTARGREFARARGLRVASTGKGGEGHAAIVEYTQRSLGRHSPAFRFQRSGVSPTTADVQPDLLLITPGGRSRIPIQACYHNQPDYEAEALLRLHRLALLGPGDANKVDFVLAVAGSKRHKDAIQRALERKNEGTMPGRIVLLDFDSVVDPEFDWAALLEFPF
jgi:hypothetical protein